MVLGRVTPRRGESACLEAGPSAQKGGMDAVREGDGLVDHQAGHGAGMGSRWTFLTNHAHVVLAIAADPSVRMREVAARVGVSERAVQMIVADLVPADT